MNKQELIDLLTTNHKNSFGIPYYSMENVIQLLNKLDEPKPQEADLSKFEKAVYNAIQEAVYEINARDVIDHSSAEFSLSGNEINLDDVEFSTSDLTDHIQDYVKNAIEDLKEEEEENN